MNYIEIATKIAKNIQITIDELYFFLNEYIKVFKNIEIDYTQFDEIVAAINMGIFDLRYAAIQALLKENWNVLTVSQNNNILFTNIYKNATED